MELQRRPTRYSHVGQGKHLSLNNLVREEAIVRINDWEDFGLALGVEPYILDRIKKDYRGVKECRREMLKERLNNCILPLTWDIVRDALDSIEISQPMSKADVQTEGERFQLAINQLKKSIPKMNASDRRIRREKLKLEEKLSEERKEWQDTQDYWKSVDDEWERERASRNRIEAALRAIGSNSQLVNEVLRENGCREALSNFEARYYLRSAKCKKQIYRSQQLRERYKTTEDHQQQVQQLTKEFDEWQELVDERIVTYKDLLELMEQLGVSHENIQALKEQLRELEDRLIEYNSASEKFKKALERRNQSIAKCAEDIQSFQKSFEVIFTNEGIIPDELKAGGAMLVGTATGATAGTAIGTAVFPVVGTVVGAGVGAAYAVWKGWFSVNSTILQDFKCTRDSAQQELDELRRMRF